MKYRDTYRIVTQISRYVSHRDFRYRATPRCRHSVLFQYNIMTIVYMTNERHTTNIYTASLPARRPPARLPAYLPARSPARQPARLPARPPACPSVRRSVHPSVHPPVRPSVHPSVHPPVRLSARLPVRPSVRLSTSLCVFSQIRPWKNCHSDIWYGAIKLTVITCQSRLIQTGAGWLFQVLLHRCTNFDLCAWCSATCLKLSLQIFVNKPCLLSLQLKRCEQICFW